MIDDPHAELRDRALHSVLEGEGESQSALSQSAAAGVGLPAELQPLIDKIHARPYTVTDDDIARLQPRYSDDQLFEIIVSAAMGASRIRLNAGLAALEKA